MAVPMELRRTGPAGPAGLAQPAAMDLRLTLHSHLGGVEGEWRRLQQTGACTVFQTFDWLATWQRHVGQRHGTRPVICLGAFANGETAFILPLAIETRRVARRLCWLGQDLGDYNAPLLAPTFSQHVTPERFVAFWRELGERLQRDPKLRYDWVELEKMPQSVGDQTNPFIHLDVTLNASGAHLTRLGEDWQKFYFEKRSSATRRHDRSKRCRMAAFGKIRYASSADLDDARHTLEILMEQKRRALAHNGIADLFAQPGYREFFLDLATNPQTRNLVHISRIEIGTDCAATNFGLVYRGCYYHVLASYDRDLPVARYGPGLLHLRELMAEAIGRKLDRFDFTIGDERYKLEWSDVHIKLYNHIHAATWRGRPARAWSIARHRLKRFIKQTPLAWRCAALIRAQAAALRRPAR
jgi:CelD/BcsL family acetyltransferase involved in cellulose biosynthesis